MSSIGASGSALSPTFIGSMRVYTGSLVGAIAVLALVFLASTAAIFLCAPGRSKARPREALASAARPRRRRSARGLLAGRISKWWQTIVLRSVGRLHRFCDGGARDLQNSCQGFGAGQSSTEPALYGIADMP